MQAPCQPFPRSPSRGRAAIGCIGIAAHAKLRRDTRVVLGDEIDVELDFGIRKAGGA
jgi:hypothetical protein